MSWLSVDLAVRVVLHAAAGLVMLVYFVTSLPLIVVAQALFVQIAPPSNVVFKLRWLVCDHAANALAPWWTLRPWK